MESTKEGNTANVLSYRHSKYAGNHGDVLKHAILVELLLSLEETDAHTTFIDTHAGAGRYTVSKDSERQDGILRLLSEEEIPSPFLQYYISLVRSCQGKGEETNSNEPLLQYPGSPWIAETILKSHIPSHELYFFDKNPTQHGPLQDNFAKQVRNETISTECSDGYEGAVRILEGSSSSGTNDNKRKHVVLIDPPYKEVTHECGQVKITVKKLLQLDPSCTIMAWIPTVSSEESNSSLQTLRKDLQSLAQELSTEHSPLQWFCASLEISKQPKSLRGSSVWVVNPPIGLSSSIILSLSWLAECLQKDCCNYLLETS